MGPVESASKFSRCCGTALVLAGGIVTLLAESGCATQTSWSVAAVCTVATAVSPVPEPVAPREAWRLAEDYARVHPRCEVLVGSGDSMLPLYGDRTVLVVERVPMGKWRMGMTVIFVGESGWPVAHTLLDQTPRGWRTMGLGNRALDRTTVRSDNYIGTVVKAFAPTVRGVATSVAPSRSVDEPGSASEPISMGAVLGTLAQLEGTDSL